MAPQDYLSFLNSGLGTGSGSNPSVGQFTSALGSFAPEATDEQKANGIISIFNFTLSSMDANADKAAEQEVQEGEKEINNINNAKDTSAAKNMEEIDKILSAIDANKKIVEDKLKEMDDTQKEKQEIEDKMKAAQAQIDSMKEKVNSSDYTPAEKRAFLKSISEAGEEIRGLAEQCKVLGNKVEEAGKEVADVQGQNEELTSDSEAKVAEGVQEQNNYNQQLVTQQAKNTKVAAGATQNVATATAAEAEIAALETSGGLLSGITGGLSGIASGAEVQRLQQIADSNYTAAATRTQGSATNKASIGSGMAGIVGNISAAGEAGSEVTGVGSECENTANDFYDVSNALGSLVDSGNALQQGTEELYAQVGTAEQKIDSEEQDGQNGQIIGETPDFEIDAA